MTQRRFEVIVPHHTDHIDALNDIQFMLGDSGNDLVYAMALAIGSDVYLTYEGLFEDTESHTQRYSVTIRAFETTTARLLGSGTGFSHSRHAETRVSVEEAMTVAITNILPSVLGYWQEDTANGLQYRVAINIKSSLSQNDFADIQAAFAEAMTATASRYRENIITRQSLDYLVWADPERIANSRALFVEIIDKFDKTVFGEDLTTIVVNRKLILLKID